MKDGTSRRDFVKAALAASVAGATATSAHGDPSPAQAANERPATSPELQAENGEIAFPRVFTGRHLARISCPLGGIGTGGIGLGGRGNLQDWQIFNRPETGNSPEFAFPSLWVGRAGEPAYSVVIERRLLPPFDLEQEGLGAANAPGLPRLAEATFHSSFPLSRIQFDDPDCSVRISLEAFSPFQPLDADASGLPCALLHYEVQNPGASATEVVVAWSIANPVGRSKGRKNEARTAPGMSGLLMTDPTMAADDALHGSFVLAALPADGAAAEALTTWSGKTWHTPPEHFWFDEFAKDGGLGKPVEPSTPVGSVSIRHMVPAGESRTFRFLMAWHFPNRTPERCGWEAPKGKEKALLGNYYCTRFEDAWAVAQHVQENLAALEQRTRDFVSTMTRSTLPPHVKDAACSNLSTLVSNTSFRIADGSFHGFEGCGEKSGLGFGTCTHVWNYEVATQFVFPTLARSMRETSFGYATDAEGHMDFRHKLPPSSERWNAAAADGQMGQIVKLYFDWISCGDDEWLHGRWPIAKRALEYAWRLSGWDETKSGVMDGVQHNTYDIEFYGPNPLCSTWYLAALRATARMAEAMGEKDFAGECDSIAENGARWIDANLFNGEFYIQQVRGIPLDKIASGLRVGMGSADTMHPDFQVGDGCFIDQLCGQYMATVAGLGDLLDPAHIRTALESIQRYNYRGDLKHHANVQRVYALNDEAAYVVCDYSKGTRPEVPMPYYAEVWTGLEYSLAALMATHGMVPQATDCIRNTRRRYDGERRNPFDETDYGRHYARPMASWSAIPALSGFRYDARAQRMMIAPKIDSERFECFWSTPAAWGSFSQSVSEMTIAPVAGVIELKELRIAPFKMSAVGAVHVTSGEKRVECVAAQDGNGVKIEFPAAVQVDSARTLRVTA